MTFNTELQWPTAFVSSVSPRCSVLAGKTGAFADSGRLIFYDRLGSCVNSLVLRQGCLPIDLVTTGQGHILASDVSGYVSKYAASDGRLVAEWSEKFHGSSGGRMVVVPASSLNSADVFLVTSAHDDLVHCYNADDGMLVSEFHLAFGKTPPEDGNPTTSGKSVAAKYEITSLALNSTHQLVVSVSNDAGIYVFDSRDGRLIRCLGCGGDPATECDQRKMKVTKSLHSGLCCDPFDNILVSDFVSNCVHLISHTGQYIGRILTEKDGISCPNFVALDPDGRLYVGQYGGEVLVFQYLSFNKNV